MVEYKCIRCGYVASQRCNFRNHLNRKNICNPLLEDISIEEIKKMYGFDIQHKMNPNEPKRTQKTQILNYNLEPKLNPNEPKMNPNEPKMNPNEPKNIHKCNYCNKCYTTNSHMRRHEKTCKKKKEVEINQKEEIAKMKQEIEELKNFKIQTQNNITNNNTINNTININNYGDENIKHLKSKDFANLLSGIYNAVPKLIQQIHFDPKHPENQNIKFTNKKLPYLKVMKNDKWELVDKKTELLDLIDNKCFLLREKYYNILEKNKYNISDNQKNIIDKFLDKYEEDDKQVLLDIINKTELVLLNNS
jgi:hypothetical protein